MAAAPDGAILITDKAQLGASSARRSRRRRSKVIDDGPLQDRIRAGEAGRPRRIAGRQPGGTAGEPAQSGSGASR